MKTIGVLALILISTFAFAKPMTSVSSWEGPFSLKTTNTPIRIKKFPTILLWEYGLKTGPQGTVIGFSTENGDSRLSPKPNNKGVQPVYTGHFVSIIDDKSAAIFITYSVQGNGGWKIIERYVYDGKTITLIDVSMNGGKPDFECFKRPNDR